MIEHISTELRTLMEAKRIDLRNSIANLQGQLAMIDATLSYTGTPPEEPLPPVTPDAVNEQIDTSKSAQ